MKIAIAGAGIGGLAAALTLHQQGFDVTVYEAVRELKPLGVGINVLPHGSSVLHHLGLNEQMDQLAIRTRAVEYRTRFGHIIQSDPRGVEAGFAFPQYSVHRGQLQFLLLETVQVRLGPDAVVAGAALQHFEQVGEKVELSFADGRSAEADLLIGADGFWSQVRAQMNLDEGPAHYAGTMMWRGACEFPQFGDGRTMFIAGNHDVKLVCYPISEEARQRGSSLVNWVAELRQDAPRAAETADWTQSASLEFLPFFSEFLMADIDIGPMFESTQNITLYPMIDRDPLTGWTQGRVSLLGDAAHPMYPIGANGASQALVDAKALAEALSNNPTPQGLLDYEKVRRPITSKVVLANRQYGPERVLDIADARIKSADDRIEDVITAEELESVAAQYRARAGFKKASE